MKHNYFSYKLLQLIYTELNLFDRLETEYVLSQNILLQEEYSTIKETVSELSKISYTPSKKSIDFIKAYAKL